MHWTDVEEINSVERSVKINKSIEAMNQMPLLWETNTISSHFKNVNIEKLTQFTYSLHEFHTRSSLRCRTASFCDGCIGLMRRKLNQWKEV